MDLLQALRSNYYKKTALHQQIVIVDACATFAERMHWVFSLPKDELPKGDPVSGREQYVLFATQPGEAALNLNVEKTGLFSRELLQILESDVGWPPDFKKIIGQLDDRFQDLCRHKQANQTPSYYWLRAGNAFDLKSYLEITVSSSERTTPHFWELNTLVNMDTFFSGGTFHQENQKGEYRGNYHENQERVEIG